MRIILPCLQVTLRRSSAAVKPSKTSKNMTYVVADSTSKENENPAKLPRGPSRLDSKSTLGLQPQGSSEATLHSGYENIAGPLTHVNGKTGHASTGKNGYTAKNGFHTAVNGEVGKVRSVPDAAILDIGPEAVGGGPQMAPRSYEALQVFDSAPRGFSLVQPS